MNHDTVYAHPRDTIEAFRFDGRVADVFENMISRSVPGYAFTLELAGLVAAQYGMEGTRCYDLGCSLGASTLVVRRHLPASCHLTGIDNSPAMVERCRAIVSRDHSEAPTEILEQDIRDTHVTNASVVVMNYTLQFIPPHERLELLARIAAGMVTGGALLLSEKIRFEDNTRQSFMTDLHHEFKRSQGYSDLEIAQKRAALENVLVPDTEAEHLDRMRDAGFRTAQVVSRCINFSSILAIR
ncbi:MAG TPA: carboxy-S-adenosyl-L-methionine synthase CmoA [Pseudomonadales bacterium]|nr:carboxy-S-adenosyl-L-methionine synthase CmoA [Pseudomonadales bacterium]